jgi:hypothetical protein
MMGILKTGTGDKGWGTGHSLCSTIYLQLTIIDFRFSIFFLLQFLFLSASAQVTTVTGSAPNFIGKEIRLVVQDDPISGADRVIDRTTVNERGGFTLKGTVEPVQYGFVQVGRECGDLFLERGKDVTVRFAPPKRPRGPEGFSDRYFFRLDFIDGDGAKLNRQLALYNDRLDRFLADIYPILKLRRNPKAVADSVSAFQKRIAVEFKDGQAFMGEHIRYSIGNIEQTFIIKKKLLHDRYLQGRPVQLWNTEYMRFIEQFHEGVVEKLILVEKRQECIAALKKSAAFSELDNLLAQKPFMDEPIIRRAILIQGLERIYGQKEFEAERISATLRAFADAGGNQTLAKGARNIALRKDRMRPGTAAPAFTLTDSEGRPNRLADFKGNYLLLEVTESNNAYCLQEAAVLRDMQKRFPSVRFLTVLVDNTEKQLQEFKRDFAPGRPVASIGRNHDFMTDYAVNSLPAFFIIGPDGRVFRSPALDPSKGGISELEVIEQSGGSYRKGGK